MKTKFAIDFSWLHSRSKYALKNLTWKVNGVSYRTGCIQGVFETIMEILRVYGDDVEIILALDGKPRKQQMISNAYKAGREKQDSILDVSRWEVAKHMLLIPQVTIAGHKWLEGDEVLCHIAKTKQPDEQVIIFSGDGDMRQLIDSKNQVYCSCNYINNSYVIEDEKYLWEEGIKDLYGLTPDAVALHLAICGDKSDGIQPIPRFIKKVSKQLCNKAKTIDGLKDLIATSYSVEDKKIKKGLDRLEDEFRQVEDNWKLTFIDPLYIPEYKSLNDFAPGEITAAWFNKFGCQKAYSVMGGMTGEYKVPTIEATPITDTSNELSNTIPNIDGQFNFEV